MMLQKLLNDNKFNVFFSFMLGLGLVCIMKPMCTGDNCSINKPPAESDFDKYVYRLGSKCYKFDTVISECPTQGAIEAFRQNMKEPYMGDSFVRRRTRIGPVEM